MRDELTENTVQIQVDMASSQSPVMQNITRTIERIAPSDLGVLLVGEVGTGKAWTAHTIHRLSNRSHRRIVELDLHSASTRNLEEYLFGYEAFSRNGTEINHGILEDASGGTVFIHGISELPLPIQRKLALVIEHQYLRRVGSHQDTPINVRFIAAINRKPRATAEGSLLRREIYYRISPIIINLPPLRERREDIPSLIREFLAEARLRYGSDKNLGITPEAVNVCLGYDWPGNIRQLRNAIEYAAMMSREEHIQTEHLPLYVHGKQAAALLGSGLKNLFSKLGKSAAGARTQQQHVSPDTTAAPPHETLNETHDTMMDPRAEEPPPLPPKGNP